MGRVQRWDGDGEAEVAVVASIAWITTKASRDPEGAFSAAEGIVVSLPRYYSMPERTAIRLAGGLMAAYLCIAAAANGATRENARTRAVQMAEVLAATAFRGWQPT